MKMSILGLLTTTLLTSTLSFADSSELNKKCQMLDQSLAGNYTGLIQVRIQNGTRVVNESSSDVKIKRTSLGMFEYSETLSAYGSPLLMTETFKFILVNQESQDTASCMLHFTDFDSTSVLVEANGTQSFTFQSSTDDKSFLKLLRK